MEGANSNFIGDDQNKRQSLRQPNTETQARLLSGLNQNNNATAAENENDSKQPRPTFAFNVNATEFVPRYTMTTQSTGEKPSLSVEATPFVPRQNSSQQPVYPDLVDEFRNTLLILTTNPGNMEEYMRPMCEMFRAINASELMQQIIELLYEQSILEPNFRYTGARVCQHICSVLKEHPVFANFRNEFLRRCQQDFNLRDHLLSNPHTVERACGLTLLMGELFQNLELVDAEGKSRKIQFLPQTLRDLLLSLLAYPSDVSVKCACQLLKLCGAAMEESLKKEEFDEVFIQLKNLSISQMLGDNVKFLIQTVLKLRDSDWGQKGVSSSSSSHDTETNHYQYHTDMSSTEPIFYNASGQPITREQAGFAYDEGEENYDDEQYVLNEEEDLEFLQWQQETMNGSAGEPNYSQWADPVENNYTENNFQYVDTGMDDEMVEDFEEFLRQQNQQ